MLKAAFKSVVRGLGYEVHRRVSEQASGLVEVAYGPSTIEMYPGSAQPGPTPDTYVWNGVTNGALGRLVTLAYGTYPDLAVIDVGANVGDTAAVIKAGADVPVFCIEGDPQIYPILQRNTRRLPGTTALQALRDRNFNQGALSTGPGPLPREPRCAGDGAPATAPVCLVGRSACGPGG